MSHATYLAWEGEKEVPTDAVNRHNKHKRFDIDSPAFPALMEAMKVHQTILDPTISVYKRLFPDSTLYQYGVSLTKLAYQNKVKIGVGTDLPINDFKAVAPIFQEMSALQNDVGMAPIDIIRGATIINAEMLGKADEIGAIEVGKKANLILLKSNPIEDIEHMKHLALVIKNGRLIKVD